MQIIAMPLGSSTACLAALNMQTGKLQLANLGDSGYFLFRSGKLLRRSKEQTREFNCPYQLGFNPMNIVETFDTPELAEVHTLTAEDGDLLVMVTDGVLDNMFDNHVARLLAGASIGGKGDGSSGHSVQAMAEALARTAHLHAHENKPGPWCKLFGQGKPDDITAMVIKIKEQ